VNIQKLIPCARNARTHSKEQILQIRASLREFGFVNPVIVDKDWGVIAGHGRIMAAKDEGITEVPCVFADISIYPTNTVMHCFKKVSRKMRVIKQIIYHLSIK
jgi:ParB-like chromosome segregation protein Spo0J